MPETQNIIYGLFCPLTHNPVYIGKTTNGIDRPFVHISEKSHSEKVNEWIHMIKNEGLAPIVIILENNVGLDLLEAKEKFWIGYYIEKGHKLLNQNSISPISIDNLYVNGLVENETDPMCHVRNYIIIRRKILKLTQKELSEKSGVGLRFIREIEQNKKDNFSTKSLFKLLKILGNVSLGVVKR